jgi:hypothetical protein
MYGLIELARAAALHAATRDEQSAFIKAAAAARIQATEALWLDQANSVHRIDQSGNADSRKRLRRPAAICAILGGIPSTAVLAAQKRDISTWLK